MIRTLIVLVCAAIGISAALGSRFNALLFYMWMAFFRPQDWAWTNLEFLKLSQISGGLLVVPSILSGQGPNVTHRLSILALLFLVCAGVGYQYADTPTVSWYWLTYLATLILVSTLLVTLVNTKTRFLQLTATVTASFIFFSAKAGLASILGGGRRYTEGLSGAFSDNNAYAVGTAVLIFPLIFVAQNVERRWVRYLAWAAAPLSMLTVISTFSRGGFLSLVVGVLVYMLLQKRRMLLLTLTAAVVPLALLVVPIPEGYFDRLQTIQTYEQIDETSALSRLYFWEVALKMSADHPLGIGPWMFESKYDEYDETGGVYGRRRAVHNTLLQALTETGWMGGATYALLFLSSWHLLFRLRRQVSRDRYAPDERHFFRTATNSLIAAMVAFAVGSTFLSMAYNDLTWVMFGMIAALDRIARRSISEAEAVATGSDALVPLRPLPGATTAGAFGSR